MSTPTQDTAATATDKGWLGNAWELAKMSTIPGYAGIKSLEMGTNAAGLSYADMTLGFNPATAAGYWGYKLVNGGMTQAQAKVLQNSDDPSKLVFEKLAKEDAFKTEDGKKALAAAQGDTKFVAALNKAIKNDPTVAPGLLGQETVDGHALDTKSIAAAMADPMKRGVLTQVLDKVGENGNDKYNFAWAVGIADAGAKGDLKHIQGQFAEAGIQNSMVDIAADPRKLFNTALQDPKAFGEQMAGMMGLSGEQGQAFAGIFQFLAQFLQLTWGNANEQGSLAHFFEKHGPNMQKGFEDLTGQTDEKNAANAQRRAAEDAVSNVTNSPVGQTVGNVLGSGGTRVLATAATQGPVKAVIALLGERDNITTNFNLMESFGLASDGKGGVTVDPARDLTKDLAEDPVITQKRQEVIGMSGGPQ